MHRNVCAVVPNINDLTQLRDISLAHSHADHPGENRVPVLFLPGSSGSKSQARSIASEAYRYAARQSPHANHSNFAVYTVGTNEELSAMDARLVNSQSQFVIRCLQHLHTLHASPVAIVVGHSMGKIMLLFLHITTR